MSERRLRYSERKAIAETGSLGPLQEEPRPQLRAALGHLIGEAGSSNAAIPFKRAAQNACAKHFGLVGEWTLRGLVNGLELDDFLDFIEIFSESASATYSIRAGHGRVNRYKPLPAVGAEINELFDRHRFGFRLDGDDIRKIGSPVLDQVVVGPALLAAKRPGWE